MGRLETICMLTGTLVLGTWHGAVQAQDQPTGTFTVPPFITGELAYHDHPVLLIFFYDPADTDASPEPMPTLTTLITPPRNLGIEWIGEEKKFREVHTHDAVSGRLHVESVDPTQKYRLGDFIELWKKEDPDIRKVIDRIRDEGIIYSFAFSPIEQRYYTARVDRNRFLHLPLDPGRRIVVFLPEKTGFEAK